MNEIEKMYENCNFEKAMGVGSPLALYPFTAEKQLELIKWLVTNKRYCEFSISWNDIGKSFQLILRNYKDGRLNCSIGGFEVPFEEIFAYLINHIWQDLTEEEKEQIREILG